MLEGLGGVLHCLVRVGARGQRHHTRSALQVIHQARGLELPAARLLGRGGAAQQAGGREALEKNLATQYAVAPSHLEQFARANLTFQELATAFGNGDPQKGTQQAQAYLAQLATETGVQVSPRFGEWTPAQLQVGPPLNDLSTPAAAPSPAPRAS